MDCACKTSGQQNPRETRYDESPSTHVIDSLFNLFPIRSALDEFVEIFRSIRAPVSRDISDDLRQVFRVGDNVNLAEHLQIRKFLGHPWLFERGNECVVGVQVGNHLETAIERDDLALDVFLQDAVRRGNWSAGQ